ncbi:cation diffusion facilitator family transporter, partial [Vicingaceae bacterium]|nr:cation diffusion facilitator family transporter [Vicingaceae bacterium]
MANKNHKHTNEAKNIKIVFFLNLIFTIFEIIGGFYVNSVAIISDAVHDLGDTLSLGSAWYLQEKSNKPANKTFSFGYKRLSLLSALINCIVLLIGSFFVIYTAIIRLFNPEHSDAQGMLMFAIFGILINGYAAWKMSSGKTLNEKVLSWHLLEDVLGWVAVLIVAIILHFEDIQYLDPALSLLIAIYILYNVVKNLKETLYIFLQGHPKDIDQNEIEEKILNIKQIESLHSTHIWSLDGEHHVFTTHVKLISIVDFNEMLSVKLQIKDIMK